MAETFCGKTCEGCPKKEILQCPGCKVGPGRQYGGDCELAQCVRGKGHETCESCTFRGNCGTLRGRDRIPDFRIRKIGSEKQRNAAVAGIVPILGKWVWVLFWLVIPCTVAGLLANENFLSWAPGVYVAGKILQAVCAAVYGWILLKLTPADSAYRTAGICNLVTTVPYLLMAFLPDGEGSSLWTMLFTLPAVVIYLVAEYQECMAHSDVLTYADSILSQKWEQLWKWRIGTYVGLLGSVVLSWIIPLLGLLLMLASMIGLLVVSVLKYVYLYRTAKCFREYPL